MRRYASGMVLLAAMGLVLAGCTTSAGGGGPGTTHDTSLGPVLVDAEGMTLYTHDGDLPDKPNCYALCALLWHPLEAAPDAQPRGNFTIVDRDGGTRQWEYKRAPLYAYALDSKPGDVGGDGVDGLWHAAKP
jgi:predicted lipoprotein with Yx(FWY)xxD motif